MSSDEEDGYDVLSSEDEPLPYSDLKRPDLKGTFKCNLCPKIFCHTSSLSRHRIHAHTANYKCTLCKKNLSSKKKLRNHMIQKHKNSTSFICRCCNLAFPEKSRLLEHLKSIGNHRAQFSANSPLLIKPIPITTPFYLEGSQEVKVEDDRSSLSRNSIQSESSSSFYSDSQFSAFHKLNNSKEVFCDQCQHKSSMIVLFEKDAIDLNSKIFNLEMRNNKMKMENQFLNDINEKYQKKLTDLQTLSLRFMKSNPLEVQEFLEQFNSVLQS